MKKSIWAGLITLYIVWGVTYLAIRFAIDTMPPFIMAGSRFLIPGLGLYIFYRIKGAPPPMLKEWMSTAVVGILLVAVGNASLTWSEYRVPSGVASLIYATIPLWMLLIDIILSRSLKLSIFEIVGIFTGFIGIVILIGPALTNIQSDYLDPLGLLVLLIGAVSIASGSIYNRDASLPSSLNLAVGMQLLVGGTALILFGTLLGEWARFDPSAVSARSWVSYFYLMIFGSTIGFLVYIWLLRVAPTRLVSTYAFVNPLVALFMGTLVGREVLTPRILLSSVIIIGSVVLINFGGSIPAGSRARRSIFSRVKN